MCVLPNVIGCSELPPQRGRESLGHLGYFVALPKWLPLPVEVNVEGFRVYTDCGVARVWWLGTLSWVNTLPGKETMSLCELYSVRPQVCQLVACRV